ncbi:MAG: hypothetical protein B9S32_00805 [Verrucomicrobia bacterium Tous-C9LFEB]|nr:MAG: hypothetical protein B9S32_00805 [Verrucomicrobia bacterium Tous-C9LFEB]
MFIGQLSAAGTNLTWFCPAEPNNPTKSGPTDYWNLFTTTYSSQWSTARSRIKVFTIYPGCLMRSSDAQLRNLFAYLNQNNIALALEGLLLTYSTTDNKGHNVEGYSAPNESTAYAQRIKNLGGNLAYLAMDEPLYYGHYYDGPNAAHSDVQSLAANVANNIRQFRAVFPNVIVGDIEPIGAMTRSDWAATVQQWLAAYKSEMGEPLAFFHVDMLWDTPWQSDIPTLVNLLTPDDIALGIILNATGTQTTSESWMQNAEVNIQRYVASGLPIPRHIVIQNWHPYPTTVLPETSPAAHAYLVNYCFGPYAAKAPPTPLYRLYHSGMGRHFYTADAAEKNACVTAGWQEEAPAGNVYNSSLSAPLLVPFYRLYHAASNNHLYTGSESEKNSAVLAGYIQEGTTGFVFTSESSGGTPLYRAYGGPSHGHFYTTSKVEYDGLSSVWTKEGICAYLP